MNANGLKSRNEGVEGKVAGFNSMSGLEGIGNGLPRGKSGQRSL